MNRRGFLVGLIAAPAIVRCSSLMAISPLPSWRTITRINLPGASCPPWVDLAARPDESRLMLFWHDTTENVVKVRDEPNQRWRTLGCARFDDAGKLLVLDQSYGPPT